MADRAVGTMPSEEKAKKKFLSELQKKADEVTKPWKDNYLANIKVMREATALPAGLTSALFGRMVTSDTAANIDAPIHVAHAFTVHPEESDSDYFVAVDDLKRDEDDSESNDGETISHRTRIPQRDALE